MNIPGPTEKLHVYLAVLGISLLAFGVWKPLQMYNLAELSRVKTRALVLEHTYATKRYVTEVNRQSESVDSVSAYKTKEEIIKHEEQVLEVYDKVMESQKALDKLERDFDEVDVALVRQGLNTDHRIRMFYLWSAVGSLLALAGLLVGFIGFRRWWAEQKAR